MNKLTKTKIRKGYNQAVSLFFPVSYRIVLEPSSRVYWKCQLQLKTSFSFPLSHFVLKKHISSPPLPHRVICCTPVHNAVEWWITPGVPNSNAARRRSAIYPLVPLRFDNSSQGSRLHTSTRNSKNHNLITTVRSSMDWRTNIPDDHFSDKVENMKAIIVPRSNRQPTSCEFSVFCDDLYRDSDMTVDEYIYIFWCNVKNKYRIMTHRYLGLNFTKSDITWLTTVTWQHRTQAHYFHGPHFNH